MIHFDCLQSAAVFTFDRIVLGIPEGLLVLVTRVAGVDAWRGEAVDWIAMCSREDPDCAIGSV